MKTMNTLALIELVRAALNELDARSTSAAIVDQPGVYIEGERIETDHGHFARESDGGWSFCFNAETWEEAAAEYGTK